MLTNEEFVRLSVELNLFFMRIMKEHMFFIEAAFTPKETNLSRQADMLRDEATKILAEAIAISDGYVSQQAAKSGEFVTEYTLRAEEATQFFTGVDLDTELTKSELGMTGGSGRVTPAIIQRTQNLNQRAITLVRDIVAYKEGLLNSVLTCKVFTTNYPLLIDHILREARFYLNMLIRLQSGSLVLSAQELADQQAFWNRIMAEHAKFIRGLLDPTEVELFKTADMFGNVFDKLTTESLAAQKQTELLTNVTRRSVLATTAIRDFKRQGTEGILDCKVKSIIIPLLGDHTLREANHFLRILKTGQTA